MLQPIAQQTNAQLDQLQNHCVHPDLQQVSGCMDPHLLPTHDLQPHLPLMHLQLLAQQLILQQDPLAARGQLSDLTCGKQRSERSSLPAAEQAHAWSWQKQQALQQSVGVVSFCCSSQQLVHGKRAWQQPTTS